MIKFVKLLKAIMYSPVLFYCIIIYLLSKNKTLIDADLLKYGYHNGKGLVKLLLANKEFRNIFYYRIGHLAMPANAFLRENPTLHITTKNIGGGLLIVHGDSTYINAKCIGENCYVNQCVTIGVIGKEAPIVGNNVRVATGAIVLGKITIGDNVLIGAGAVVVKSIPSNCTVVGNPAYIVKKNGKRVREMLK